MGIEIILGLALLLVGMFAVLQYRKAKTLEGTLTSVEAISSSRLVSLEDRASEIGRLKNEHTEYRKVVSREMNELRERADAVAKAGQLNLEENHNLRSRIRAVEDLSTPKMASIGKRMLAAARGEGD